MAFEGKSHKDIFKGPENYHLKRKAVENGMSYRPLSHDSKRWRMIAWNEMLKMMNENY